MAIIIMKAAMLVQLFVALYTVSAVHIATVGYPGGDSHHFIHSKIGKALVAAGHTFTFLQANIDDGSTNCDGFKQMMYQAPYSKEYFLEQVGEIAKKDPISGTIRLIELQVAMCEGLLTNEAIIDHFKENPVDLILGDNTYFCQLLLADQLKAPVVALAPVAFYDPILSDPYGIPTSPAYVPMMGTHMTPVMTLPQRALNLITYFANKAVQRFVFFAQYDELARKLGITSTCAEMITKVEMVLATSSHALEFARPLPPHVKLVGSVLAAPPSPLPDELEAWMSATGKKDVVLVSFGTISFPEPGQLAKLVEGLGRLPYRVLMKWRGDPPQDLPANVRTEAWVAQNDVLGHAATAAFLTHAGMNSMTEAGYHGVPTVTMAMFGDQFDNAARLSHAGMSMLLDRDSFSSEDVVDQVRRVVEQPQYAANAKRVSGIMQEDDGARNIVAWVDYYLRHGTDHLRVTQATQLPWYSLCMLDAVAVIMVPLLLLIFCLYKLTAAVACKACKALGFCKKGGKSKTL